MNWRFLLVVVIIIAAGAGWWWLYMQDVEENITTYQQCVDAGYPIQESYPPQCRTADGRTFVGPSDPHITTNPLIQVRQPQPQQTVSHHLTVSGSARGSWYFEASFPVKVLDSHGEVVTSTTAQAQGEWMTEEFVPFNATVDIPANFTGPARLLLERSNPSDLPQNNSSIQIPVIVQ